MRLSALLRNAISLWRTFIARLSGTRRRYDWMRSSTQAKDEA
jgi:hypothetical protein